jgi:hypothetical protein
MWRVAVPNFNGPFAPLMGGGVLDTLRETFDGPRRCTNIQWLPPLQIRLCRSRKESKRWPLRRTSRVKRHHLATVVSANANRIRS